jgi:hypothetical protein
MHFDEQLFTLRTTIAKFQDNQHFARTWKYFVGLALERICAALRHSAPAQCVCFHGVLCCILAIRCHCSGTTPHFVFQDNGNGGNWQFNYCIV